MDKESFEFNFEMLTMRQLLKLCSTYNIYIQGAMPNYKTPYQDILDVVNKELNLESNGLIQRKNDKPSDKEARIIKNNAIRVVIV